MKWDSVIAFTLGTMVDAVQTTYRLSSEIITAFKPKESHESQESA
jgi:hypothetical protein